MAIPPWRLRLQPASYNGVTFHVDVGTRTSGRRKHLHEFPKKNVGYLEDMGRKARRWTVQAYVIGPNFEDYRDALIEELEADGNGTLVHPTDGEDTVGVETYSVTERRERGGWAEFEMTFTEAGEDVSGLGEIDTQSAVSESVDNAVPTASSTEGSFASSSDINALVPTDL